MIDLTANLAQARPAAGAFLPIALAFILAEYMFARLSHHDEQHDAREILASVGVAVGDVLSRILTGGIAVIPFAFLFQHRLFDIPLDNPMSWIALFLSVEFFYYWFHRASHRIRWLWATHAVHHSATRFNLSAAIRLGWTGTLTGAFVFFLPLAWIGFHPVAIVAMLGIGLIYQFFLHTSIDVGLGPLEWVLNSPRHHRVHHACNDHYLDCNFGSVLIVFDRLFGTFVALERSGEPIRYGLKGRAPSNNPFAIALGEWARLIADLHAAKTWRDGLGVLFGRP
jgi:sterol desaturase/sphingolipid hydroxylase (fatty acid hydroxylase superfamily)